MACRTCGGDHRDDACREGTGSLTRGAVLDGRYELFEELGHGGMSRVYRARHTAMDREVAIKVLASELRHDTVHAQRFLREARLTGALMHPNIVTVFDAGASSEGLYLVMELVRGKPLSAIDRAQLPWRRVVRIGVQICQALEAAHARGIIHRDLKASNVMLLEDGGTDLVKVVDFGIAAALHDDAEPLTAPNAVLGSANAIAPELIASSQALTPRADLYSLGALLHQLLTGQPPFGTGPLEVVVKRQLATDPPPCLGEFPPALGELVGRLLRRDPAQRPATAKETAELLRAVLDVGDAGVVAGGQRGGGGSSGGDAGASPRRRRRQAWVLASLAGVGVLSWALLGGSTGRGTAVGSASVDAFDAGAEPQASPHPGPLAVPAPLEQGAPLTSDAGSAPLDGGTFSLPTRERSARRATLV